MKFTVERQWPYWTVWVRWKYSGRLIASFWTRVNADEAAERLNWANERNTETLAGEVKYEEWMQQCMKGSWL